MSLTLFGVLIFRLIDLQLLRHGYFSTVAESQRKRASELMPHRGTIYVREGRGSDQMSIFPVASNEQGWLAYAVPRDMADPAAIADKLAPALAAYRARQQARTQQIVRETGQSLLISESPAPTPEAGDSQDSVDKLRQELFDKFNRRGDPYEPFLRPYELLDEEFHQFLIDNKLSGIQIEEEEARVYPEKSLAAHVLGFLGYEEKGQVGRYGIEGQWQNQLAGKQGFLASERDAKGKFINIGERQFEAAKNGDDVVLTIDRVVQAFIEDELRKGVEKYGAERGSIVVMNPKTGEVLGMATYPTFDPNYYYSINNPRVQLNPVISEMFEPGSILKPVIMAAAMDVGLIKPETTMIDNGPVRVADRVVNTFDGKHHGTQTMTQILEQSNNVGMVWVGQQLGAERMYDFFRRFGLGERTGIELEGETQVTLREPQKWNVTTVATSAFGQGVAVTPLQALNAINALANGGLLMQPRIVSETRHSDGASDKTVPTPVRQVVSSDTASAVSSMMVSVIENGVAQLARVPGYYLAGKTGTAQVPDERGKYSPDRKIISFVGFGPVAKPQFSIMIKLDNPAGLSFASGTAAPMFGNVAEKLLQYYQIPPSYSPQDKKKTYRVGGVGG